MKPDRDCECGDTQPGARSRERKMALQWPLHCRPGRDNESPDGAMDGIAFEARGLGKTL